MEYVNVKLSTENVSLVIVAASINLSSTSDYGKYISGSLKQDLTESDIKTLFTMQDKTVTVYVQNVVIFEGRLDSINITFDSRSSTFALSFSNIILRTDT